MRHLCVGLFVVAALAAGCTKRVADPDEIRRGDRPASDYYPLAVGNSWTYHAKFLGQETDQTVKILGVKDGFYEDSTGAHLTVDAWGVRDERRYLLRDPVTVGEGWTNVISVSTVEHYKIIEAGQSCEVPAGRFPDCTRVESRNKANPKTTLIAEMTFAAGVGLVRVQTWAETEDQRRIPQTTLELTAFDVKGGAR